MQRANIFEQIGAIKLLELFSQVAKIYVPHDD